MVSQLTCETCLLTWFGHKDDKERCPRCAAMDGQREIERMREEIERLRAGIVVLDRALSRKEVG